LYFPKQIQLDFQGKSPKFNNRQTKRTYDEIASPAASERLFFVEFSYLIIPNGAEFYLRKEKRVDFKNLEYCHIENQDGGSPKRIYLIKNIHRHYRLRLNYVC